jgi:AcrR family transcriptional regulator
MDRHERHQQILRHARDVFARQGFHASNIDDIVESAGIARGTFYLYFDDKRSVFEALVDRFMGRLRATITRVDPSHPTLPVEQQIKGNVQRVIALIFEDRATTKLLLNDAMGIDPAFDAKLARFYDDLATLLEESLRDGQFLGIVASGDTRLFAYFAMGALREIVFQVLIRGVEVPPASGGDETAGLVDSIFEFLRGGFLRLPHFVPHLNTRRNDDDTRVTETVGPDSVTGTALLTRANTSSSTAAARRSTHPESTANLAKG